jgi:hypothetical protein
LAALTYFPLFGALTAAANPALARAQATAPVTVVADPDDCSFQFDPVGKNRFDARSCDVAKAYLAKASVSYDNVAAPAGTPASVRIGDRVIQGIDAATLASDGRKDAIANYQDRLHTELTAVGYPAKADPAGINRPLVVGILFLLALYVTMVYGPIAALLVELFPTRIRYTSMSLPYHIGNGWFGGFLPTTAFAMVAATGDIYYGLWYPIVVALVTLVAGLLFLPETFRRKLN